MNRETVTKENIDELLRYLPRFEKPERRFTVQWKWPEKPRPYPVYCDDVEEFFTIAHKSCWMDPDYDPGKEYLLLREKDNIEHADLKELRKMITFCARGERMCDCRWDELLRKGVIQALLRRLKEIRDSMS